MAKSEGIWNNYWPPIEGQEFLAIRIRIEVLEAPKEEVFLVYPYWHLTLRYESGGNDTWGIHMPSEKWAEGYAPIEGGGWYFFVVRQGSDPLLYFQPMLMIHEQVGYRTSGAYFDLRSP